MCQFYSWSKPCQLVLVVSCEVINGWVSTIFLTNGKILCWVFMQWGESIYTIVVTPFMGHFIMDSPNGPLVVEEKIIWCTWKLTYLDMNKLCYIYHLVVICQKHTQYFLAFKVPSRCLNVYVNKKSKLMIWRCLVSSWLLKSFWNHYYVVFFSKWNISKIINNDDYLELKMS